MPAGSNIKTFFVIALALIVLGLGNVIFGRVKRNEFERQLLAAQQELATGEETPPAFPLLSSSMNVDKQSRYIGKLNAQLEFYKLVVLGGKCFLAAGGIFLLLTLISIRQE